MAKVRIEIPEDVLEALRLPPDEIEEELRKELAVALYARKLLPFGKARALAGMTKWEFEELLGQRRVSRDYTLEDLRDDIAYAGGGE